MSRATQAANRALWNAAVKAARAGEQPKTLSEIATEQAAETARHREQLVDDPHVPGGRISKDLADVHPELRLTAAIENRTRQDQAKTEGSDGE